MRPTKIDNERTNRILRSKFELAVVTKTLILIIGPETNRDGCYQLLFDLCDHFGSANRHQSTQFSGYSHFLSHSRGARVCIQPAAQTVDNVFFSPKLKFRLLNISTGVILDFTGIMWLKLG